MTHQNTAPEDRPVAQNPPRCHMRTVNGGTPERIGTPEALQEINAAMMGEGRKGVREMSAKDGIARIIYNDVRGAVALRPATDDETTMDVKPEAERYAAGDRVIVRGTYYRRETRTTHVLDEYEGIIVNWHSGHYNVRAVEPDEYGCGVRECEVRELRPVPPTVSDVADAPHTLYVNGEPRHENIPADRVRKIVSNLRFQKKPFTQDSEGAICVENRRYTPQRPTGPTEPTAREYALRLEAQQLATNKVIEEAARAVLQASGHCEAAEGGAGFIFRTNHLAVCLYAMDTKGSHWTHLMDSYRELLEMKDWFVRDGHGYHGSKLTLLPPDTDASAMVQEGARRRKAAEEVQAAPAAPLAADPIPADVSVYDGMPGRPLESDEIRNTNGLLLHDEYVVQIRSRGAWIMPNHDEPAVMNRGHVSGAMRRMNAYRSSRARFSIADDGTVYVSDGFDAARYTPVALLADYNPGSCPSCGTPYASNGDGPCPGPSPEPARPMYYTVTERIEPGGEILWTARAEGRKVTLNVQCPQENGMWDTDVLRKALAVHAGVSKDRVRSVRGRSETGVAPRRWDVHYPAAGEDEQFPVPAAEDDDRPRPGLAPEPDSPTSKNTRGTTT